MKARVSADAALRDARSESGESAIVTAVDHRQKGIANLLVARGATLPRVEAPAVGVVERAERWLEAAVLLTRHGA